MRTNRVPVFRLAALASLVAVLLIVAGCAPLPEATPTTAAMLTFTPMPSPTAGADETATEPPATAQPGDTAEPTATSPADGPTSTPLPGTPMSTEPAVAATATATGPAAAPTATATGPAVAATATSQPTNTPLPPTNTPVPPTATPSLTPTPPPPRITDWRGEYFDDPALQPPAVVVRNDRVVDFQWGAGESPAAGIPNENYSARWTRDWNFETGNYRFEVVVDDGARLWVGGNLIVDAWTDGAPREFASTLYLQGQVPIRLEY